MVSSLEKNAFHINGSSTRLEKKDTGILNYIVVRLLWVAKGGRPDI